MFKFKVNDTIKITAGKDKNQTGKIVKVFRQLNKVIVEGKNIYKKHRKKQGEQAGQIEQLSRPLPVANIALVCPNCNKPTRVGFDAKSDPKVRICRKCGKAIISTKS
ncbi:50S ribosomal protein L24 [Candidatus Collierbacteria bacterium]|nr:50S ribosomal protein L24 [Candidatus Collierbacteria bacterium]